MKIEGDYRTTGRTAVRKTKSNNMLLKMLGSFWRCFRRRSARYIHARGCPVSVAEQLNYLSSIGGIANPNLDPRLVLPLNIAYWRMRIGHLLNRLFG